MLNLYFKRDKISTCRVFALYVIEASNPIKNLHISKNVFNEVHFNSEVTINTLIKKPEDILKLYLKNVRAWKCLIVASKIRILETRNRMKDIYISKFSL